MNREDKSRLLAFTMRDSIIAYSQYNAAIAGIEMLHQRSRIAQVAGGLLLTGYTGSGKSTVKEQYAIRYERYETKTATIIPVLTVDTPSNPTVRSLVSAMLEALGDPASHRGTTEEKTVRLYKLLKACHVELLFIDEFQHFQDRGKIHEMQMATDWLKNVINTAKIPVVIMGLPSSASAVSMNEQLRRRFSSHITIDPFSTDQDSFTEFVGVLGVVQETLPIRCVNLADNEIAYRFLIATNGLIDFVAKMIDGAVEIAWQRNLSEISIETLELAFVNSIWKNCPSKLNPFSATKTDLRFLQRVAEPFDFMRQEYADARH